jgi:hypothetical protein
MIMYGKIHGLLSHVSLLANADVGLSGLRLQEEFAGLFDRNIFAVYRYFYF